MGKQRFYLLPNPRFMYLSQPHQNTTAACVRRVNLLYFHKDRTAAFCLWGPLGTGKTLPPRLLAQEVDGDAETNTANVNAIKVKTSNLLLRLICAHFQVKTERR